MRETSGAELPTEFPLCRHPHVFRVFYVHVLDVWVDEVLLMHDHIHILSIYIYIYIYIMCCPTTIHDVCVQGTRCRSIMQLINRIIQMLVRLKVVNIYIFRADVPLSKLLAHPTVDKSELGSAATSEVPHE